MIELEYERKRQGLSQREIMRRSGVDSALLSKAERWGLKLYPAQAERVAKAIGWTDDPAELFQEVSEVEQLAH